MIPLHPFMLGVAVGLFTEIIAVALWWAHGRATALGTANADEALRQLLHMCQWVDRE